MKKIYLLVMAVMFCFTLISCADTRKDEPSNAPNPESTAQQNTSVEAELPDDGDDNSMFEYPENPKKFVVNYIRSMAMTQWTPETTFHLYGKYQSWNYNLTYEAGSTYYGLPFLVNSRGTKQEFENSLEDGVYVGGTSTSTCIGDACYDAVYVSLIQVCPSITFKSTEDMLPGNNTGLKAVGDWDWSASKHDTQTIINTNSQQQMAKAYAELEPGDVVLKHIVAQDAGHTRIVSGGPVVYYNSDGSIDINKSYITTIEQTNVWDSQTTLNTTWWVDHVYTFSKLYSTYFVPLTPVDYTADLADPFINAKGVIGSDEIADARKLKGTLTSNHYITEVSVEITNSDGKTIYETSVYPNTKQFWLEDIRYSPKLFEYSGGTYRFTLKASLATGTKTIADYDFVLE